MALITTPGAANANSYPSLAEADAYFAVHVDDAVKAAWIAATDPEQEAALILATRLLDAMPQAWKGQATYEIQALGHPRIGLLNRNGFPIDETIVHQILKDADSEFAGQLLVTTENLENDDVLNQGIARVKAGSVEVAFEKRDRLAELILGNPGADLAGKFMVPDLVRVMLVPQWLLLNAAQAAPSTSSFIFTNLMR